MSLIRGFMKRVLLLASLLVMLTSCDKQDEEEDISDLKRMVQAPQSHDSLLQALEKKR